MARCEWAVASRQSDAAAATALTWPTAAINHPPPMTVPAQAPHWTQLPRAPAPGTVICALEALPDLQATMVSVPTATNAPDDTLAHDDTAFKLLLLRQGNTVHAFANRCAHFGIPLAAQQAQLIQTPLKSLTCNVHYARYRWADGRCEAGECNGESLTVVPVVLDSQGLLRVGDSGSPA